MASFTPGRQSFNIPKNSVPQAVWSDAQAAHIPEAGHGVDNPAYSLLHPKGSPMSKSARSAAGSDNHSLDSLRWQRVLTRGEGTSHVEKKDEGAATCSRASSRIALLGSKLSSEEVRRSMRDGRRHGKESIRLRLGNRTTVDCSESICNSNKYGPISTSSRREASSDLIFQLTVGRRKSAVWYDERQVAQHQTIVAQVLRRQVIPLIAPEPRSMDTECNVGLVSKYWVTSAGKKVNEKQQTVQQLKDMMAVGEGVKSPVAAKCRSKCRRQNWLALHLTFSWSEVSSCGRLRARLAEVPVMSPEVIVILAMESKVVSRFARFVFEVEQEFMKTGYFIADSSSTMDDNEVLGQTKSEGKWSVADQDRYSKMEEILLHKPCLQTPMSPTCRISVTACLQTTPEGCSTANQRASAGGDAEKLFIAPVTRRGDSKLTVRSRGTTYEIAPPPRTGILSTSVGSTDVSDEPPPSRLWYYDVRRDTPVSTLKVQKKARQTHYTIKHIKPSNH
ncbi:hypothetical protein BDZ89DRAFT_1111176 [Hymenopellis radicata]|nr:hypothetical protein BDZ89DRAFT_1111176 [Hymenopellis radicata]